MRAFVQFALFAAWFCVITASPLPASKYSDSSKDQSVLTAEDHLFNDEGFPLRVQVHAQEFAGVSGDDNEKYFPVSSVRDSSPYGSPFSGFFFDMQDMMKILRDQMSEVLARVPPESSVGHEDRLLPSDVKNQTTTKVEYVDGHKVVINDTTYSNGDTNHGSIFHVQIVDLLPLDDGSDPSVPAPPPIRPNEVDSTRPEAEDRERDREEVEEDDEEIGEDIDEVARKPAKKVELPVAKEKKEKPREAKQKPEEEVEREPKVAVVEPKKSKVDKVENKETKDEEDVETFDDLEEDEQEGEDIPEKKMQQKDDIMHTAESRWQNEIDNRIDTYQPYYNYQPYYKRNYNRQPDIYYDSYKPEQPTYNRQPYPKQPISFETPYKQPVYSEQPKYNGYQPIYSEPPRFSYEPTYRPEPIYEQPKYSSHQPIYAEQPKQNSFEPTYKPDYHSYRPTHPKDSDKFIDLSGDTKVNDFMAAQQQAGLIMIEPDAEFIDVDKKPVSKLQYPRYNYRNY